MLRRIRSASGRAVVGGSLAALLAAGFLAGGAAGAVRYVDTFWLYRGYAAPVVPATVVVRTATGTRTARVHAGTTQEIWVRSPALGGHRQPAYVYLPPGYAASAPRRYPVLYLLHGFPGGPVGFLNAADVGVTEDVLIAEHRIAPMILVMPSGSPGFLVDEEWANGVRPHNGWETFVAHDLVRAIDARYRTIASGAGRALGGLSEGGYGALNIGLHHPGEFRVLESWSGYMQADHIPAIFGRSPALLRYNSPMEQLAVVAPRLRRDHTFVWFYAGTHDYTVSQNRQFAAELTALGLPHFFAIRPGGHDWRLWRSMLTQALIAVSRRLAHG